MVIEVQGLSVAGGRLLNQDNMYINHTIGTELCVKRLGFPYKEPLCFAVADGVGGASSGDEAALLALKSLDKWHSELNLNNADIPSVIKDAFDVFNEEIVNFADEIYADTGTTLTLLLLWKDNFYLANVGDSPAIWVRKKKLATISERQGEDNMLYSFLGNREADGSQMVHITKGQYKDGDTFFLCSDGITNTLETKQLLGQLCKRKTSIEKIIDKTVKNGPQDNCTGILIQIHEQNGDI